MINSDPNAHHEGKNQRVFIVHGRNYALVEAVSTILRSMGLETLDFSEVRLAESFRGRYIGEVLDHAFDIAQAVVVIVSGEEMAKLSARFALPHDFPLKAQLQPRPNVLIEIGMALRSHAERVVLLEFPPLRDISDLAGLVTLKFNRDEAKFQTELSARLRQAGCVVSASKPVNNGILRVALAQRRMRPVLRYYSPRIGLALLILAALIICTEMWVRPNWCARSCQEANGFYTSGTALWIQANSNSQYLQLYKKALDEYYKAFRLQPDNLTYRASVAATLNDLGLYDRTVSEMVPFAESMEFKSTVGDAAAWLRGEIAAAYFMKGEAAKAQEYTELAARTHPHFRDWIPRTVEKYRRQDEIRRQPINDLKQ